MCLESWRKLEKNTSPKKFEFYHSASSNMRTIRINIKKWTRQYSKIKRSEFRVKLTISGAPFLGTAALSLELSFLGVLVLMGVINFFLTFGGSSRGSGTYIKIHRYYKRVTNKYQNVARNRAIPQVFLVSQLFHRLFLLVSQIRHYRASLLVHLK